MSDQPETTADDILPNPTPDETARLMREGGHSKVPWWKRLLPPWMFSVGLHLFLLPFVLILTVTFADSLLRPTVWNDVRDEKLGEDPYSHLFIDRDDGIAEGQEKVVKVADVRSTVPETKQGTGKQIAAKITTAPSTTPVPTVPTTNPFPIDPPSLVQGTVVTAKAGQIVIALADRNQRTFQTDENTQFFRAGDLRFFAIEGGVDGVLPTTSVTITSVVKDGKNIARLVSVGPVAQPKPPQTGTNGNIVIEQPARSIPGGNQIPDVIYVPTPRAVVDRMLQLAKVQAGEVVFDLGCGDGRIPIIAAKKFGALGVGYDINPERIKESVENAKKQGVTSGALFERRDIFKLDLSKADVVTLYLLPSLNARLIPQFEKMKPGSRIVSHDFDMSAQTIPDQEIEMDATDDNGNQRTHKIYMWTIPLKKQKQQP